MKDKRLAAALLTAMVAIYAVLEWFVPQQADDIHVGKWFVELQPPSGGFSLSGYWDFVCAFRAGDNGRLANLLFPFVGVMMPQWAYSVLFGLACTLTVYLAARLSAQQSGRVGYGSLLMAWAMVAFLLPWRDHLITLDFAMNYVFTSAAVLGCLYILSRAIAGRLSRGWLAGAAVVCFFGGMMHEGFTVPMSAGIAVAVLCHRRLLRNRGFMVCCAAFVAGALICTLCPGTINRASEDLQDFSGSIIGFLAKSVVVLLVVAMILLLLAKKSTRKQCHEWLSNPINIIIVITMMGSFIICLMMLGGHRILTCGNLMAAIVIMSLMRGVVHVRVGRRARMAITVAATLLMLAFFGNVIVRQRAIAIQHQKIVAISDSGDNPTVYYDLIDFNPILTWGYTTEYTWRWLLHYAHYMDLRKKEIAVVPTAFRGIGRDSGRAIPGDANIREYKGHLFAPKDQIDISKYYRSPNSTDDRNYCVVLRRVSNGESRAVVYDFLSFRADDGTYCYYVYPEHRYRYKRATIDELWIQ